MRAAVKQGRSPWAAASSWQKGEEDGVEVVRCDSRGPCC